MKMKHFDYVFGAKIHSFSINRPEIGGLTSLFAVVDLHDKGGNQIAAPHRRRCH